MRKCSVIAGLSLWLAACGGSDAESPKGDAGPFGSVTSDSKALTLQVRTGPDQPPSRGISTVEFDITAADSGEPKDGLELTVVPWMPAMGHGTSVKPVIAADGGGHYTVSNVNLYMGGAWDLRIAIANGPDAGDDADHATVHFKIR
ncbi:MAG TPA: FixH family protein [Polyangiales bacterium]|jgi:hypothetical protein